MDQQQTFFQKNLAVIVLLVCSIPLFFLNIQHAQSSGGDDYAQYIKEAQNLATGRPYYESNYVFNKYNNCYSPPQYPPGYPLMLAPVVKIWGLAIAPMCYFNTVIAACLLLCFFFYFRKHMSDMAAVCLAIVIAYGEMMLNLKQAILSDAASLLFVMLYLIARNAKTFHWRRIALLAVFAAAAILVRTQSVLLLFAEAIYLSLLVVKEWIKNKKLPVALITKGPSLYIVAGGFLLTAILNKLVFYRPDTAAGFYVDFLKITLQKGLLTVVRDNVNFFLEALGSLFHYETSNSIRTAIVTVMQNFGLSFCLIGFVIAVRRRLCFDDIFFVLVCGLILYYPIHDARYFLPAIAIVFYYCYTALRRVLPVITAVRLRYVGLALTAVYLFAGGLYFKASLYAHPGYVPEQKDIQAFSYLKEHARDNELIICARPRLITLYTNRRCVIHAWQHPMDVNKKIFDSMQAKYLLQMDGIVNEYYNTYLAQYQHPIDSNRIAPGYTLYTLR